MQNIELTENYWEVVRVYSTDKKDWGMAVRTMLVLISYRTSRIWDEVLFALVPVKQLFPAAKLRSTRSHRWASRADLRRQGSLKRSCDEKEDVTGAGR